MYVKLMHEIEAISLCMCTNDETLPVKGLVGLERKSSSVSKSIELASSKYACCKDWRMASICESKGT